MYTFRQVVLPLLMFLPLLGCVYEWGTPPVTDSPSSESLQLDPEFPGAFDEKSEKVEWGPQDRPSLFSDDLEYRFDALPLSGEAENIPWASSYWPVWEDSINHRWDGADSDSPAAKYGEAFGVAGMEDMVSAHHGIDRYQNRTPCEATDECNSAIGEACAIREGETAGHCIPTWWGICHAWAPVAILEREPEQPVERNGVVFEVNDIKALATLAYNSTLSRFVSLRCNEDEEAGDITYDAYERPTGDDIECADTNPGTFHVILANYLGIRGESFVEDRTFDDEVWNQPMRGFEVVSHEEIDAAAANAYVGVEEDEPSLIDSFSGALEPQGWSHQPPVAAEGGAHVEVSMTGTGGDADLYVRLGGQPTATQYDCRPYSSSSDEACSIDVPAEGAEVFVSVRGYSGNPEFEVRVETPGAPLDEYLFNENAERFIHVVVKADYITESPSWLDGNLSDSIGSYTRSDIYQYVLELDGEGLIIGGEWIGSSKRNHPDFLWLPEERNPTQPIAGGALDYQLVRELIDESMVEDSEPVSGSVAVREIGNLERGEWAHFGPFDLDSGSFSAVMTGTGDADLYVRRGSAPTTSSYDCRPYRSDSQETCEMLVAGSYYVGVRGYRASTYDLNITVTPADDNGSEENTETPPEEPFLGHLDTSGAVERGEMLHYTIDLDAGQFIVVRTTAPNDVDLYLRFGQAPTTALYDLRAFSVSGNETLEFMAGTSGTLHIGVSGWESSDFTLVTSAN